MLFETSSASDTLIHVSLGAPSLILIAERLGLFALMNPKKNGNGSNGNGYVNGKCETQTTLRAEVIPLLNNQAKALDSVVEAMQKNTEAINRLAMAMEVRERVEKLAHEQRAGAD